jgi:Cof subfamily protein (haloacid dehalogenase superfamily)
MTVPEEPDRNLSASAPTGAGTVSDGQAAPTPAPSPAPPSIDAPGAPRPAFVPEAVVLDLDGTLLDGDQHLDARARDAVRTAIARGLRVVLATGRMYRSALPWARELGVRCPLICYQGAVVRALPTEDAPTVDGVPLGELIAEDALAPEVAVTVIECARRGGWHVQAYLDERLLCEEDRPEGHLYARIAQVPLVVVDDLVAAVRERGSIKVVCVVDDPPEADRCERTLRECLGERARVTRSLPPFVEVTDPNASKGRALRRLAAHCGFDVARAVAVGDAPNDADMLAAVGYAVAVEGAPAEVLGVADVTCPPPDAAGIAVVLEALGLV